MANITEGYQNRIAPETIRWEKGKKGYTHFKNDDVVFAKIIPCFQNLKSTVLHDLENGYGCGTTEFFVIRCNKQHLMPEYVLWFLKNPLFIKDGLSTLKGTVGQQRIGAEFVEESLFPLPPINEQKTIIHRINQLLNISDQHEQIIDVADLMKKNLRASILNAAIQGKLVPQDPNDEPVKIDCKNPIVRRDNSYYEVIEGKEVCIDEEIPFEIPETWCWCRLDSLGIIGGGKTPSTSIESYWGGTIPWISSKDVKTEEIKVTGRCLTDGGAESMQIYPRGSLIFVMRSGILRHTFPIAILGINSTVNQDIKVLIVNSNYSNKFLYYAIYSRESYILNHCSKDGTTVESIDYMKLRALLIPMPPQKEQNRIVSKIKELLGLLNTLQ